MDGPEKIIFDRSARSLRFINIVAFIPGIVLLLISGLRISTTAALINLIAVAPLTLSALLGLVCVTSIDRPMPWMIYADLCLIMFYVSILVPTYVRSGYTSRTSLDSLTIRNLCFRWVTLASYANCPGCVPEVLLCAYSTMPLILNLYVSCCPYCARSLSLSLPANLVKAWSICISLQLALAPILTSKTSSCIHTYLFLRTIPNIVIRACSHCHQPRSCPNCRYAVPPPADPPRWKLYKHHDGPLRSPFGNQLEPIANDIFERPHGDDIWDGNQEHCHLSLADYHAGMAARESSEFQTSGCNTPRQSTETLSSSRVSSDMDFN